MSASSWWRDRGSTSTPLPRKVNCAAAAADIRLFAVLLKKNIISVAGETPILLAAGAEGRDALPVLRYLLDRGGDPAMPDARGSTPLHNAAEYGMRRNFMCAALGMQQSVIRKLFALALWRSSGCV